MEDRFESFLSITSEVHKHVRRIKAEEMAGMNLKSGHALCIYYLHKHGKLSLTQLSAKCKEDKSALSRAVDYLRSEGYITSEKDGGYKKPLRLTEKGVSAGEDLQKRIDRILEISDVGITEEDRLVMYRTLEKISKNLACICKSYDETTRKEHK